MNEDFLHRKIQQRKEQDAYRRLPVPGEGIDFCSNDYLGIAKNNLLHGQTALYSSGSTGSRLLTGNSLLAEETEAEMAAFHHAEAALIFNSGYDANTGLLAAVPQRGDTVLYDALSHASIRDGLRLSLANTISFLHNDIVDLEKKLSTAKENIFVVTESVFSMDGDMAPVKEFVLLCNRYKAHLMVDEAHATGVIGSRGEGLVQSLGVEHECFARIYTFGKALGGHGAAVVGSTLLKEYLVNFCRPFIYTTAPPPVSIAAMRDSYRLFPNMNAERLQLQLLIDRFRALPVGFTKTNSLSPVQSVLIPGNTAVKSVAAICRQHHFDIRAILYPTVPKGSERLRVVLHSFNTEKQVEDLAALLLAASQA